jgi:hypothetical protein
MDVREARDERLLRISQWNNWKAQNGFVYFKRVFKEGDQVLVESDQVPSAPQRCIQGSNKPSQDDLMTPFLS